MTKEPHDPTARRLSTRCVHAGRRPGPGDEGVALPIDRSTTFVLDETAYALREAGRSHEARVYSRESGPTIEAVEAKLAALDGAEGALLFSSGLAALHAACLARVSHGDRLVHSEALYGGSVELLEGLAQSMGLELASFEPESPEDLARAIGPGARLVLVESLSNPSLRVADLPGLAQTCGRADAQLVVDATFASPVAQRPLEHGAGLVWHSATKFLGGHSDLLGGVLCGDEQVLAPARRWRTMAGAAPDPQAAWLLERGLKTLALRVAAACGNATELARRLAEHPRVANVRHPSRFEGSERERADRVLDLPGAMLTFHVEGGDAAARSVCGRLRLILEAASLGGVETLVSPPVRMSHVGMSESALRAAGIGPGCLRLSVGVEDVEDLWADLEQALESSTEP